MSNRNPDGTFIKGVSGNPTGKKPGTRNIKNQLEEILDKKIARLSLLEKDELGFDAPKIMTVGEHMIERLIAKALGKDEDLSTIDLKAIDMIYDRLEGKAVARSATKDAKSWDELLAVVEGRADGDEGDD